MITHSFHKAFLLPIVSHFHLQSKEEFIYCKFKVQSPPWLYNLIHTIQSSSRPHLFSIQKYKLKRLSRHSILILSIQFNYFHNAIIMKKFKSWTSVSIQEILSNLLKSNFVPNFNRFPSTEKNLFIFAFKIVRFAYHFCFKKHKIEVHPRKL